MTVRQVTLRPATDDDRDFLYRVYASTREPELATMGWSTEQKRWFLDMQFGAQDKSYRENHPGAEFLVADISGVPAGRLYLCRNDTELRIMDIALLPEYRGQGIGNSILRDLITDGNCQQLAISLHVEKENPALNWYRRLGFRAVREAGVYWFMVREPGQ